MIYYDKNTDEFIVLTVSTQSSGEWNIHIRFSLKVGTQGRENSDMNSLAV